MQFRELSDRAKLSIPLTVLPTQLSSGHNKEVPISNAKHNQMLPEPERYNYRVVTELESHADCHYH